MSTNIDSPEPVFDLFDPRRESFELDVELFQFGFIAFSLFLLIFKISGIIAPILISMFDPDFLRIEEKSKKEYSTRVLSFIHATIAAPISVYCVWFACDEGSIFSSDECVMTPQPI